MSDIWPAIVTNLALQFNPAAARRQFGDFCSISRPSFFPQAKSAFDSLADTIERRRFSSFVVARILSWTRKEDHHVNGTQRQWVESQFIDTATKLTFLNYLMADGSFPIDLDRGEKEHMVNGKM